MTKVLIVAYYWPPAGGPGVQRWLKFVTYLPEFGIEPVLLVPENAAYPLEDMALLEEIPKNITVYKQPISEPLHWVKSIFGNTSKKISAGIIKRKKDQGIIERLLLWIRGNFFIPDARITWVKTATNKAMEILNTHEIQTLITTGPPHSVHLIGYNCKRKTSLRWMADFRDPWTGIGYHDKMKLSTYAQKKHKELEKKVLNTADLIITTSLKTKGNFSKLTPKPIQTIYNGYENNRHLSRKQNAEDDYFCFTHIGSLLNERNPLILWKVLSEIAQEDCHFKSKFKLKLVGLVGEEVIASIRAHHLDWALEILSYTPHSQALEYQANASILLLIEINAPTTSEIIPGKLFEYLAAHRPILAIGPKNWEAGLIVDDQKAGRYFTYSDEAHLKTQMLIWFEDFNKGNLSVASKNIQVFHRKNLTSELASLIHGNHN